MRSGFAEWTTIDPMRELTLLSQKDGRDAFDLWGIEKKMILQDTDIIDIGGCSIIRRLGICNFIIHISTRTPVLCLCYVIMKLHSLRSELYTFVWYHFLLVNWLASSRRHSCVCYLKLYYKNCWFLITWLAHKVCLRTFELPCFL